MDRPLADRNVGVELNMRHFIACIIGLLLVAASASAQTKTVGTIKLNGNARDFYGGDGVFHNSPFDLIFTLSGKPAASTTYPWIVFTRAVSFSANWSGSWCRDLVNATSTTQITVKKNGSTVGTIDFNTNGTCTFATSGGSTVSVVAGDFFTFVTPSQDATLSDVMVTLAGTR